MAHLEIEYEYRKRKLLRLRNYNHVLTLGADLPVHTAVVYLHGGAPGLTRRCLGEVSFGYVPYAFVYNSLGLSGASAREYLGRPEPLAWAFAVLMSPQGFQSRAELAIACLRRILDAPGLDEDRRFRLLNFVRTSRKASRKASRRASRRAPRRCEAWSSISSPSALAASPRRLGSASPASRRWTTWPSWPGKCSRWTLSKS